MTLRMKHNGKVSDGGKLVLYGKKSFEKELEQYSSQEVTIIIERRVRKRSLKQNNYYWAVVIPLTLSGMIDAGWDIDREGVHDFLRSNFAYDMIVDKDTGEIMTGPDDKPLIQVFRTSKMTTIEFNAFIEKIQMWAVEYLNVNIPSPNEQIEFTFKH